MRDTLVPGDRNFGFDAGGAFDAKFHGTLIIRFGLGHRARGKWRQATLSIERIQQLVQRGSAGLFRFLYLLLFGPRKYRRAEEAEEVEEEKKTRWFAPLARYGTRKIFCVYGSFTSVPGGKPRTST